MRPNGLVDVYILEILQRGANEEHPMKQTKLVKELEKYPYELSLHRNTIRTYVNELDACGYIVKTKKGVYKKGIFTDQELRLLMDGVLFGHHIPKTEAENLIDKLKKQSELGLKDRMRNVHYLQGISRAENDNLTEMIDVIDEAINKGKKIKAVRCAYDETKKLKRLPGEYVLDPYAIVTEGSRYYLICNMAKNGVEKGVRNLRVDRLLSVKISKSQARDIRTIKGYEGGLVLDEYMHQHFYMMSGDPVHVTMDVNKEYIGSFIDWFGKDFTVFPKDEKNVTVKFTVIDQAIIPWVLQYGDLVTVTGPDSLRRQIQKKVEKLSEKYL